MEEDEILDTSESPSTSDRLTISPFFDVPEGVDFQYSTLDTDEPEEEVFEPLTPESDDGNEPSYDGSDTSPTTAQFRDELSTDSEENSLLPPTDFVIISQTARIGPDGTIRVDVVLGFEEADGAENYEVRSSKA